MPKADPAKSFDVAVRHLFRHLGDLNALRRNPLGRSALGLTDDAASPHDASLRVAIIEKLLTAGRTCLTDDLAAGLAAKAHRQFAILSNICDGRPASEVAKELELSQPQYYRDRREITHRVVRLLLAKTPAQGTPTAAYDRLDFGMWRASMLTEQGFSARAVAECEAIASGASRPDVKALALLKLGDAALRIGDDRQAQAALHRGRALAQESIATTERRTTIDATAKLLEFRISMHEGERDQATAVMHSLAHDRQTLEAASVDDDLRIELLLEWGRFSAYLGDLTEANAAIDRAAEIARRNPAVGLATRVEIAVFAASFGDQCRRDPAVALLKMDQAREMGRFAGSAMGVLFATIALCHLSAALGDQAQASTHADRAIEMARAMEGRQSLRFTAASLAPALIKLRRFTVLEGLLADVEDGSLPMTDLWTDLRLARGLVRARQNRPNDAVEPLTNAVAGSMKLHRTRTQINALRELALALAAGGDSAGARDSIREAISVAESANERGELRLTYGAAGKILHDDRLLKLAASL